MANYGIKQFNYSNVSTYRGELASAKQNMIELFNRYGNEVNRIDEVWLGSSGAASTTEMQTLREIYNGFLNKVNEFENALQYAENQFISTESQASTEYNKG